MREWAVAVTLLGLSLIVTALLVGLCRLLGGWTWIYAWLTGSKEETVCLTKNEQCSGNGYMVNSESDAAFDRVAPPYRQSSISNDVYMTNEKKNVIGSQGPKPMHPVKPPAPPPPTAFATERRRSLNGDTRISPSDIPDILTLDDGSMPKLQRAMSCDSVSSDTSVILDVLDSPQQNGTLEIGLEYDGETEDLIVIVNSAKGLVGPGPNIVVDSYIRVFLLPDKSTNMQTRIQRKTNDPVFKERFLFGVDRRELGHRSVLCYVYTCDKYTNTMIGEAEIKLLDIDLRQPYTTWVPVLDSNQKPTDLGDIMFSLSYLPTAERLTVVVVKARNLRFPGGQVTGDPFVKVYLLQNGKKISKKKTSMKKDESNPIFNEAMIFSVPSQALQTIQLRLTVANYRQDGKAPSIGHVFVGAHCTGKSLSHWNQMMSSLRKPIAMWHPLRK